MGACSLLLDVVCWWVIFYSLGALRQGFGDDATGSQALVSAIQCLSTMLCLYLVGGYDRRTNFVSLNYMSEHFITLISAGLLGALVIYVGRAFGHVGMVSSGVLLGSQLAFAPISLCCRRALRQAAQTQMRSAYFLVLGIGDKARQLYQSNLGAPAPQRLRFVDPNLSGTPATPEGTATPEAGQFPAEVMTFGTFAELLTSGSGVVIAEDAQRLSPALLEWLGRLHYEHVPVYTMETFYGRFWRRVPVRAIDAMWPLQLEAQLAQSSVYAHGKRLLDVVISASALVLLSPLCALIVLLIHLESDGPAVFRQRRVGRDRAVFTVYKFRSMYNRPPEAAGSLYTTENDPRITRVGRWLRKLRLDELPQLWNVLRGDMSLIGPRAEWDQLVGKYEEAIPFYHFRHLVKSGITGWAQVNYPYGVSEEDAVQKLKYDLYYIRHYSLRLDAMIVLKTLHTVLWGKGQ